VVLVPKLAIRPLRSIEEIRKVRIKTLTLWTGLAGAVVLIVGGILVHRFGLAGALAIGVGGGVLLITGLSFTVRHVASRVRPGQVAAPAMDSTIRPTRADAEFDRIFGELLERAKSFSTWRYYEIERNSKEAERVQIGEMRRWFHDAKAFLRDHVSAEAAARFDFKGDDTDLFKQFIVNRATWVGLVENKRDELIAAVDEHRKRSLA